VLEEGNRELARQAQRVAKPGRADVPVAVDQLEGLADQTVEVLSGEKCI
jgi:hypothetical protein